jgi:hypothetical protein
MRLCRDCSSPLTEAPAVLCPRCRSEAAEKRKARNRARTRARYSDAQRVKTPKKKPPPHPCVTAGCPHPAFGKSLFCPACRRARGVARQKRWRDRVIAETLGLPPGPPTSLKWLDSFSDWAKSGLSYAEYQKKSRS